MVVGKVTEGAAPSTGSSTMALCELIALLNKTMQEAALTQGRTSDSLSKGLDQTTTLLKTYNDAISNQLSEIDSLNSSIKALQPWVMGLSILAAVVVLGGLGAAAVGIAATGIAASAVSAGTALVSIAGGVTSMVDGAYTLELGHATASLADKNGTVSGLTGAQQGYQAMNKWVLDQMGSTFTSMADMTRGGSTGIKAVYDGVSMAGKDMLRGVLGQKI